MNNENFILIKVKEDQLGIIKFLNESLNGKYSRYYNLNANDKFTIANLEKNVVYRIVFIIFSEEYDLNKIYLGECRIKDNDNLDYTIKYKIESRLVIENFKLNLGINLELDFNSNSYVSIETSIDLINELEFSCKDLYKVDVQAYENQKYEELDSEKLYSDLSQKNGNCKRAIGKVIGSHSTRGEFQRDRERLIHSKSLRRLVDKAQIFTSSKGDHYRTRMTHTLEVSQISKGISIALQLNNELTESISIAHDIGHTPFGHQGERTINDILKNKINIIPNCKLLKTGGFKHNFQGIRVLTYLEEKYLEFEGLDLSYQVLEGVLKHTGVSVGDCNLCERKECKSKCFDINEFLVNGETKYLFLDINHSTTLEGQIVNISDEIAQRGHDLDDAFASKYINIDDLISSCKIKRMKPIHDILEDIRNNINEMEQKDRFFIEKDNMIRSRVVSEIITYFINDVIDNSKKNMDEFDREDELFIEHKRISKKLIEFSKEGQFIILYLESLINKKVINSFEVSRFDGKASHIIENLFRAYYNNIKILPDSTLRRIYREIKNVSNNVIDFRNGNSELVRQEIDHICHKDIGETDEEYILKRKIIVRNIADHISGMTDNYAINEYERIYNV